MIAYSRSDTSVAGSPSAWARRPSHQLGVSSCMPSSPWSDSSVAATPSTGSHCRPNSLPSSPKPPTLVVYQKRGSPEHRSERDLSNAQMQVVCAYETYFQEITSQWQSHVENLTLNWQESVNRLIEETQESIKPVPMQHEVIMEQYQEQLTRAMFPVTSRLDAIETVLQSEKSNSEKKEQHDLMRNMHKMNLVTLDHLNVNRQDMCDLQRRSLHVVAMGDQMDELRELVRGSVGAVNNDLLPKLQSLAQDVQSVKEDLRDSSGKVGRILVAMEQLPDKSFASQDQVADIDSFLRNNNPRELTAEVKHVKAKVKDIGAKHETLLNKLDTLIKQTSPDLGPCSVRSRANEFSDGSAELTCEVGREIFKGGDVLKEISAQTDSMDFVKNEVSRIGNLLSLAKIEDIDRNMKTMHVILEKINEGTQLLASQPFVENVSTVADCSKDFGAQIEQVKQLKMHVSDMEHDMMTMRGNIEVFSDCSKLLSHEAFATRMCILSDCAKDIGDQVMLIQQFNHSLTTGETIYFGQPAGTLNRAAELKQNLEQMLSLSRASELKAGSELTPAEHQASQPEVWARYWNNRCGVGTDSPAEI